MIDEKKIIEFDKSYNANKKHLEAMIDRWEKYPNGFEKFKGPDAAKKNDAMRVKRKDIAAKEIKDLKLKLQKAKEDYVGIRRKMLAIVKSESKTYHGNMKKDLADLNSRKLPANKRLKVFSELIRSGKIKSMGALYVAYAAYLVGEGYLDKNGKILKTAGD